MQTDRIFQVATAITVLVYYQGLTQFKGTQHPHAHPHIRTSTLNPVHPSPILEMIQERITEWSPDRVSV